jgi:hypothetical protein
MDPLTLTDRDGARWTAFSGIWYRRESSGGYGECRGTLTMLDRDFGPLSGTDGCPIPPKDMTVRRALADVHQHFCADDAHDDACRVLTEAIE